MCRVCLCTSSSVKLCTLHQNYIKEVSALWRDDTVTAKVTAVYDTAIIYRLSWSVDYFNNIKVRDLLMTNDFKKLVLLSQNDQFRFCREAAESDTHLTSGCKILLADDH